MKSIAFAQVSGYTVKGLDQTIKVSGVELRGTTFLNLTPHALSLYLLSGAVIEIDAPKRFTDTFGFNLPEDQEPRQVDVKDLPRIELMQNEITEEGDPFRTLITAYNAPNNVPEPVKGTLYIVSALMATAMKAAGRLDFVTVNALYRRDIKIGCDGFNLSL